MDRAQAKETLQAVSSKGLFSAIIFFECVVTGDADERHMYADDNCECINWLGTQIPNYEKYNRPYIAYLNGKLYKQNTGDKDLWE